MTFMSPCPIPSTITIACPIPSTIIISVQETRP